MIYSLLMVDYDGTCNCTDVHHIKKISLWFSVWALVHVHSILTSGSEWTGKKTKKARPSFFIQVLPIPMSLFSAKIKSFEKNNIVFLIIFTHSTLIQHRWGKWLRYQAFIYVKLKKTNKKKQRMCLCSFCCYWGGEIVMRGLKMAASLLQNDGDIPSAKAHTLLFPLSAGDFITVILYMNFSYKNSSL